MKQVGRCLLVRSKNNAILAGEDGGTMRVISTEMLEDKVILIVQAAGRKLRFSISLDDARRLHQFRIDRGEFSKIYTSASESEREK